MGEKVRDRPLLDEALTTGFSGQATVEPPTAPSPGPWKVAIVTSVIGAATGWVIEEVAQRARGRKRGRKRRRR